jgi:hypothetical protein
MQCHGPGCGLDSLRRLTGGQRRLEIIAGSTVGRRLVDLWFVCKLLGSEGSRRRGINTGSSEVTEVYARSPVSLVTWIERSLGLKGVKIIVRTVNQSSLSRSLCPAIVCKSAQI